MVKYSNVKHAKDMYNMADPHITEDLATCLVGNNTVFPSIYMKMVLDGINVPIPS